MSLLIEKGASLHTTDGNGFTLLMKALELEHDDVIDMLLSDQEKKMDLNLQNEEGETILHRSAAADAVELMTKLLAKGANPLLTDANGNTPLMHAAQRTVNVLLSHKQVRDNISTRNEQGQTALHCAFENGRPEILPSLLYIGGANPTIADQEGTTPLDMARNYLSDDATRWENLLKVRREEKEKAASICDRSSSVISPISLTHDDDASLCLFSLPLQKIGCYP